MSIFFKVLEFEENFDSYNSVEQRSIIDSFRSEIEAKNKQLNKSFSLVVNTPIKKRNITKKPIVKHRSFRVINKHTSIESYFSNNHLKN